MSEITSLLEAEASKAYLGDDALLTTQETAELLRLSPRTLEGWRMYGRGPRCVSLSRSRTAQKRYRLGEIRAWAADPVAYEAGQISGTAAE